MQDPSHITAYPNRFTRAELYQRAWSTPVSRLAEEFGISGRGLGKLCASRDIPVPHNLVADVDAAPKQQILDLAQRKRVVDVHHHRQANYLRRTVEIAERIFHPTKLRTTLFRINLVCFDSALSNPLPLPKLWPSYRGRTSANGQKLIFIQHLRSSKKWPNHPNSGILCPSLLWAEIAVPKLKRCQPQVRNVLYELASKSFEQDDRSLAVSIDEVGTTILVGRKHKEGAVNGEKFTFASVGVRAELSAKHYFKADSVAGLRAKWLDRAFEICKRESSRNDAVLDNYLRFVCGTFDIVREAAKAIDQQRGWVFGILDFVRTALPHIREINPKSLIALTEAQHEHTKNDGARGVFFNALETHIKTDIRKLEEIINSVRPKLNDANASLYNLSLISLAAKKPGKATDIALKDALSKKPKVAEVAVSVLGRLLALSYVPKQKRKRVISQLRSALSHSKNDVRQSAIVGIAECALSSPELEQDLEKLLLNEDVHAYRALSAVMWQQSTVALAHPNFEDWLLYLTDLPISEYGALSHVDLVLFECLNAGASETVLNFYTEFLTTKSLNEIGKKDLPSLFQTSFHKLLEDKNLRDRLITEWLGRESEPLIVGVEAILGELQLHKMPGPEFSSNTIDKFDNATLMLALKRMLGVVFYSDQYMSLVFSLFKVKRAEKRTYHHIEDILKNEVGSDYPEDTLKYCKIFCKRRKSGKIFELCNRVIASIEAYLGDLRQLPHLAELKPSPKLLEKIRSAQTETMQRAQKSAEEGSLVSLFTRIPIKAGRATFSYDGDAYQAPSGFHSFEHSVSFPRQHSLDSVGYEISRLIYRVSKRDVQ